MTVPGGLSVVIPTRNRHTRLERCLRSLDAGADVEIVVVDQSDAPLRAADLPRPVVVHRLPVPQVAVARNVGALRARTAFVAFLDDDVIVEPGWTAAVAAAITDDLAPAAVFGAVLPDDGPGLPYCEVAHPDPRRFHRLTPPWEVGRSANLVIDRFLLLSMGGFPAGARPSGEDSYLILRLLRAGHEVLFHPGMRVRHERKSPVARAASRGPYGLGMGRVLRRSAAEGDRWAIAVAAAAALAQLPQLAAGDPQMRREGRTYIRAFLRGITEGRRGWFERD
jgi:GT2 family glycosyltransferase